MKLKMGRTTRAAILAGTWRERIPGTLPPPATSETTQIRVTLAAGAAGIGPRPHRRPLRGCRRP